MDALSDLAPEGPLGSPAQTEPKDTDPTEKKVRFDTATENVEEDGRIEKRKTHPEESDPNEFGAVEKRPTYTRMSRKYLSPGVLNKYKIDYMIDDMDRDYILIKRWVPEYEQDFLWAATKELREKTELERKKYESQPPQPFHPRDKPQVVEVNRAKREAELDLTINRIPLDKWLELKGSDKRGRHVLDVAMRPCSLMEVVTGSAASGTPKPIELKTLDAEETSIPVRLAINSTHVLHELSKIGNMGFRTGRNVVIPPWKPFVTYYDAIIERLQTLKRLQCQRGATGKAADETASTDPLEEASSNQKQKETNPNESEDGGLQPCEVCELAYPPHETPLECLEIRISHLQCLVDFLDNDLKHVFELRRDLAAGKVHEIAFEDLWHLFNPGDLIVSPRQGQAFRVFHTSGGRPLLTSCENFEKRVVVTNFRIDCFYIDFTQTTLGPLYEMVTIGEYSGKRDITALYGEFFHNRDFGHTSVFPARFLGNYESFIANLIKRGRRRLKFEPYSFKRYHGFEYMIDQRRGELYRPRQQSGDKFPLSPTSVELMSGQFTSDIIIDSKREGFIPMDFVDIQVDWRETAEGCQHYGPTRYFSPKEPISDISRPDCLCSDIALDEVIDENRAARYKEDLHLLNIHGRNDDLTDDHFLLLPSTIGAFVLQKRNWVTLSIDLIQDIEVESEETLKKSGLEDLILPEDYPNILEALIKGQPNTRAEKELEPPPQTQFTEVSQRREGLIILLHGGSGLGKTSTAECIAAYTQRPLYPIPCNDILDKEELDMVIQEHLIRAQEWNCIVLIDDIDSRIRSTAVTSRFSSFCRALDNFRGTMILTAQNTSFANQTLLSRIHVSLHFPTFDQDSTMRVWQKNIDRIRTNGLTYMSNEAEKAILSFAKSEYVKGRRWDGRQIRNCLQTAVSLAEHDATKQSPGLVRKRKWGVEENVTLLEPSERSSLTWKTIETAAILTGKLVRSAES